MRSPSSMIAPRQRIPRSIASTAYDTAWVASLPDPSDAARPRFPETAAWLANNQHADGSWGGAIAYQHDRIISTLAAIRAIAQFPIQPASRDAIDRGQRYVWQHAHLLRTEPIELVGFELLLPTLAQAVEAAGVALPPYLDSYAAERARKLALIPPDLRYSSQLTLCHSLEFLGRDLDPAQLARAQGANGSIGNSPAATAFLLLHDPDNRAALAYIETCLASDTSMGVPVLFPCEHFDTLWSAYHRLLGGVSAQRAITQDQADGYERALAGSGICLADTFPIPDADDTAVAILLLRERGRPVATSALDSFERERLYASFAYERHPSSGVNMHVLDALKRMPPSADRDARVAKILAFLDEARIHGTYWIDKWHISPYYATSHALMALEALDVSPAVDALAEQLAAVALDWLRHTQRPDGSWGFFQVGTAEETAYAVLALSRLGSARTSSDRAALQRALGFLRRHADDPLPPLWIDKCLYTPSNIVAEVIQSALRAARRHTAMLHTSALPIFA